MKFEKLLQELSFKTALSSGPGGQHVNKTETKVILEWDLSSSQAFTGEKLQKIREKLKNYISKDDVLQLNSSKTRSQHKNKSIVIERCLKLVEEALTPKKERKSTQATKASKLKRLTKKKQHAEIKKNRRKPTI